MLILLALRDGAVLQRRTEKTLSQVLVPASVSRDDALTSEHAKRETFNSQVPC